MIAEKRAGCTDRTCDNYFSPIDGDGRKQSGANSIRSYLGHNQQDASVLVTEGVTEYYYYSNQANSTDTGRINFIALEVGAYDYVLTADDHETATGVITVVEGEGTQTETLVLIAQPKLTLTPNELQVGVVQGETESYDMSITNNGAAPMTGVSVSLPSALPWMLKASLILCRISRLERV